jgi:hypothetical protein
VTTATARGKQMPLFRKGKCQLAAFDAFVSKRHDWRSPEANDVVDQHA